MQEPMNELKSEIVRHGIKYRQLAAACGVPYHKINGMLNGFTQPDQHLIGRIREALAAISAGKVQV